MLSLWVPRCSCLDCYDAIEKQDKYLLKILIIASITKKWPGSNPPRKDQWIEIIEEIYAMETLTSHSRSYLSKEIVQMVHLQSEEKIPLTVCFVCLNI